MKYGLINNMEIEKISTIIPRAIEKIKIDNKRITAYDIESLWSKVAGEKIRAHSYVYKEEKDSLFIKVDSSSYLLELTLKKEELLKSINTESPKKFKKLVFLI